MLYNPEDLASAAKASDFTDLLRKAYQNLNSTLILSHVDDKIQENLSEPDIQPHVINEFFEELGQVHSRMKVSLSTTIPSLHTISNRIEQRHGQIKDLHTVPSQDV